MSKENVKAFYAAVTKDTTMQKEMEAMAKKFEDLSKEEVTQKLISFAGSKGYSFSVADIEAFEKSQIVQLSPDELDKVNAAKGICVFLGISDRAETYGLGACAILGIGFGGKSKDYYTK